MSCLFKAKHYVYLCPDPLLLIFVQELEKNDSWNHGMISCLLLGKHWNTVFTFFTFLRVFVPLGTFFLNFYTGLSLHNSHHEEHLSPPQRWFLSTAFAILLRSLQWNKRGAFWRGGCYAVMYLPSSGVLPVPKQTYRLPFCLSIRLLQTESGTLCVCVCQLLPLCL